MCALHECATPSLKADVLQACTYIHRTAWGSSAAPIVRRSRVHQRGSFLTSVSATVSSVTGVPKCVSSRPDRAVLVDSLVIVSMFTTPYGESRSASEAAAALEAKAEAAAAVRLECILRSQLLPTACTPCCPKPQPRPVAVRCAPRNAAPT